MKKQIALSVLAVLAIASMVYVQRVSTAQKPEANAQPLNMPMNVQAESPKANHIALAKKGMPFSIEYAENSPIKSIPLKNAKMNVKVYYYNNPDGVLALKTNDDQQFGLKYKDLKAVAMEVIYIEGQEKAHANCFGETNPGVSTIKVSCRKEEA